MRIKVDFDDMTLYSDGERTEEDERKLRELSERGIWINNFPCRLHKGDMLSAEMFGEELRSFLDRGIIDDGPIVSCHRFDIDEQGEIYQTVWLD